MIEAPRWWWWRRAACAVVPPSHPIPTPEWTPDWTLFATSSLALLLPCHAIRPSQPVFSIHFFTFSTKTRPRLTKTQ